MSGATTVPETHGQSGGDARDQLRKTGMLRLLVDAGKRFHAADGTSYARALGLSSVLSLIPALIAAVGLSLTFHLEEFNAVLRDAITSLAPGPAGSVLTEALRSKGPGGLALVAGLVGMLVTGSLAMSHLERGANRIYGVDEHRPARRRFAVAFAMAATAGTLLMVGLVVIASGGAVGDAARGSGASTAGTSSIWSFLRWPIGVLLVALPMTAIFKVSPNRRQPHFSWLLSGTMVSVALWIASTVLLALFYEHGTTLGDTYGPLLGVMALLVWAYLTAVAVLFGLAFAAQLEAERAGAPRAEVEEAEVRDDAVRSDRGAVAQSVRAADS
jgi:YihY family inner membrane protein